MVIAQVAGQATLVGNHGNPNTRQRHRPCFFLITATVLAGCTANGLGVEIHAVVERIDADQRLLVVTAGQQHRAIRVPEGVKVVNAEGRESPDGLKAKELCAGAAITLVAEPKDGKPSLREIRLGAKAEPSAPSYSHTQQDTSRLVPLTDLGQRQYRGFPGGLYPEGKNTRPASHEVAGVKLAQQVQPLDTEGEASSDGKIVLLGIGFSNTVQAFAGFVKVVQRDRGVNPKLVLVNGAVGGMSAAMVQNPDDQKRGTQYWATVDERLKAAGVTRPQVQVVWIKETDPAPHEGGFPKYTQALESELTKIVQTLRQRFPNLKLAYLSSRTYGGWARRPGRGVPGNSEPFSYESGFAVKWLIERQLRPDPALNFDPTKGEVRAPWLSWAAYLWTNGTTPRGDGVFFTIDDFQQRDRMHESPGGQEKVGSLLLRFFETDPTTKPWFVR